MKIVIASDSFKGSMSSLDVATAASAVSLKFILTQRLFLSMLPMVARVQSRQLWMP